MSDAIFNATTVGGQLFGIQSFSGIINYFDLSDRIERTEYYICVNTNDPAVLINGPVALDPDNWKLIGEVQVRYNTNNDVVKIWRSK